VKNTNKNFEVNGLNLGFDPKTLALRRLACGPRVWLENGPAGAPLWQLFVTDVWGQSETLDGATAKTVAARMVGATLRLDWRGVRNPKSKAGPFDVRVTVAPSAAGPTLTAWRLSVKNRSTTHTLWHVTFPRLAGLTPGKNAATDRVFWPEVWGMQATGWDAMTFVSGACGEHGKHSAQFMGFTRANRSLYLGAHDAGQWPKRMTFDPGKAAAKNRRAVLSFQANPEGMTLAGNSYEQAYDIVVGEVKGDWYDVSRTYAAWAREQSWVSCPPARADHGPRENREIIAWAQASINPFPNDRVVTVNGKPAAEWVRDTIALRRKLGVRLGVHMYCWHQTPFDTNYPDYFPAKTGFKELVAEFQRADVLVMPYINGRLWDHNAPSYGAEAERHAVKCSAQRVNPPQVFAWPEAYGNGQLLVTMCMHTEFWRRKVVELCRRIVEELGCGGVYLDQLGCSGSRTCIDPHHGHPLGGGDFWLAGYRKLMTAIREAIGPGPLLTTENNWEACVADFDALLDVGNWTHENNLPIFPAVFWGRGAIYGGVENGGAFAGDGADFVQRMGMRFVWGGQMGWGGTDLLLKKENRALLDYFTSLCRLRSEYARFFCRGEFLRPPEVWLADGTPCANPLKGPVLASRWSDPDAPEKAAVFLVNVTRKTQRVRVKLTNSTVDLKLAPLAAMVVPVERNGTRKT
jgi:hypothetical protein